MVEILPSMLKFLILKMQNIRQKTWFVNFIQTNTLYLYFNIYLWVCGATSFVNLPSWAEKLLLNNYIHHIGL